MTVPNNPHDPRALCEILANSDGSKHYIVQRAKVNNKLFLAQVDVWWNRSEKYQLGGRTYMDEGLILRQQPDGGERADVIILTLAQCYALLDAVSRAIESR